MQNPRFSSLLQKIVIFTALVFMAQAFVSEAFALKQTGPRSVRIRVLSYNIKGLPALINPQYDTARYAEIGRILAQRKAAGTSPDIVLLQESFDAKTADLRREAKYPFVAVGPSSSKLLDSGLYVLSAFPIEAKSTVLYGAADCGTWDCFAAKGAQMVRVRFPGVPVPVTFVNTHTQSGAKYEVARESQLQDLVQYLKQVLPSNDGSIVGGDFNTMPSRSTFTNFERNSGLTSVGRVCLTEGSGCGVAAGTDKSMILANSVDHFFINPGTTLHVKPLAVGRTFEKPVNGRMLSDHLGYEVIYELSW
jgi:endonuclease/exonuclease/phosphatase family metal-dependent hydrolase